MGTPIEGLARLREAARSDLLARRCEELGITMLVVFGSALDDDPARPPSDLDVAIRLGDDASTTLVDAINALIDLTGTTDVDVLDLAGADVVARAQALGPGSEPLYEAESGAVAIAQMAALTYAMETAPMRRRDLELLAEP